MSVDITSRTADIREIDWWALLPHLPSPFTHTHISECTVYSTHCTEWTVHCALYTVHCTLCTVHCALYTVHCTLYTVHCALYTVHCTLCTVHCALYALPFTLYAVRCTLHTIQWDWRVSRFPPFSFETHIPVDWGSDQVDSSFLSIQLQCKSLIYNTPISIYKSILKGKIVYLLDFLGGDN